MSNAASSFDMTCVWSTIVLLGMLGYLFNAAGSAGDGARLAPPGTPSKEQDWNRHARGNGPDHGSRPRPGRPPASTGVSSPSREGELVSIVGPSGCGKSTLLRCVAGLIRPTGGRVVLRGVPVDAVPDGLAVVFQDYSRSLFPWLTVRDNVALPLRRTTPGRAAARQAADAALAAVGLASGRADRRRRTSTRGSCRAACSSGSPSPAPWPATRCCC